MTEYMSKNEYDATLRLSAKMERCLVACAQELSLISSGRELIGEFDGDTDLYVDDRYLIRFETWSCGESSFDSIYVPREYIYDEGFREYYRKNRVQERKEAEERKLRQEEERKAKTYRVITDERAVYERLKKKFGDTDGDL